MLKEDDIVDLDSKKTRLTLYLLQDLLQNSQDISTAHESIQKHVLSLSLLLLKGPEPTFMNITWEKLEKAGVRKGFLKFYEDKLANLKFPMTNTASEDVVECLQSRIEKIFSYVCKYYPLGCRMVLDEILFALAEISSFESPETGNRSVAILGKTKLTDGEDQIQLVNPDSGYELGLSDEVDYVLVEYHNDMKTRFPGRESVYHFAFLSMNDSDAFL
ncbi:hypothetical protein Clacol_006139 [Clathrus columnatus]|uniref:Uncharacterized protein n=1 Tax=Clathrus columnatus TaxID=1419009 RepID=A0AAV5AHE3_9AGAM|nr:hypothetical protein Clacol_006139 [Clathrus columnatus]